MNGIQKCAGINLTASRLQLIDLERESDKLLVTNIGQTFINPPIDFEDSVEAKTQSQLQTAFNDIIIRNPIHSRVASFTLPPEIFFIVQLPYDSNLNSREIREELNWEISQLFPFIRVDDLAIKFYELETGLLPGRNNALIVAIEKKYLVTIKNFCQNNNLIPKLVDNASITANTFINNYFRSDDNSATLHIYSSKNTFTFFINISSKPAYVKVIQKHKEGITSSFLQELYTEKFQKILHSPFVNGIISGEDIDAESITEIQRITGLEFKKFVPFDVVKFKPGYQNADISDEYFGNFTAVTAIASRFL